MKTMIEFANLKFKLAKMQAERDAKQEDTHTRFVADQNATDTAQNDAHAKFVVAQNLTDAVQNKNAKVMGSFLKSTTCAEAAASGMDIATLNQDFVNECKDLCAEYMTLEFCSFYA